MFLTPYTITSFGKNIIVLPESSIYDEIPNIKDNEIEIVTEYLESLFKKYSERVNNSTYYQVILWAMDGKLNGDIWTFDLKSWDYNTDINVINFLGDVLDDSHTMVTNADGFFLLAKVEEKRRGYANIEDFMDSYATKPDPTHR